MHFDSFSPVIYIIRGQTHSWRQHQECFNSLLNKTKITFCLFSDRSQKTSKSGKSISDNSASASCATFLLLPHFNVIYDLLLNSLQGHMKSTLRPLHLLKCIFFNIKNLTMDIKFPAFSLARRTQAISSGYTCCT